MPMNLRNSVIDLGVFISKTAEVLLGSTDTPCASMLWPRNVRQFVEAIAPEWHDKRGEMLGTLLQGDLPEPAVTIKLTEDSRSC